MTHSYDSYNCFNNLLFKSSSEITMKPFVIAATAQNKLVLSPSCLNLSFSSPSQEIEIFNQSDDQVLNFIFDFDPEILEILDVAGILRIFRLKL